MATQKWNRVNIVIVLLIQMAGTALGQSAKRFSFAEPHLGTIVEITLYAPDESAANEAAKAAFTRVKQLDAIFSDYKPDSEAMRLCDQAGTGRAIKVGPELFQVLRESLIVAERTGGAFDVTVGPLVKLWRKARKEKKLPTEDEIAKAKELVGWQWVSLNEADQTAELKRPGMRLDFGGIAKGFIAQDVSQLLRKRDLPQTLVALSGDIVAGDSPPTGEKWRVSVAPLPGADRSSGRLLLLENCAVSTSGDAFQFVEIAGVRYSHIVDPRTGLGLTRRSNVTVVAKHGLDADAWDTAICVLGPERGLKLLDDQRGLDALIVQATDDGIEVFETKGFRSREAK